MKKILMLSTVAVFALSAPAFAEHHEGDHGKDHGWAEFDKDGDHMLSKEEFLAKKAAHFDKMDTDHDGKLSKEEMKAKWKDMKGKHDKKDH